MSKFSNETAEYELKVLVETDDAWLVSDEDNHEDENSDFWLPKSRIEVAPTNPRIGSIATFTIPNWLAEKKALL